MGTPHQDILNTIRLVSLFCSYTICLCFNVYVLRDIVLSQESQNFSFSNMKSQFIAHLVMMKRPEKLRRRNLINSYTKK